MKFYDSNKIPYFSGNMYLSISQLRSTIISSVQTHLLKYIESWPPSLVTSYLLLNNLYKFSAKYFLT